MKHFLEIFLTNVKIKYHAFAILLSTLQNMVSPPCRDDAAVDGQEVERNDQHRHYKQGENGGEK